MIDCDNYCFCMQCDVTCPQAGSGCGRCLDRKAKKLVELGIQQAKEGKGKPLDFKLEEDSEWLEVDSE